MNYKNLAVIPARSGSKGLAHKNIKLLNGKPLIAYTIEVAKESGLFDEIYVSTDSEEYGKIALEYGAKVPFLRSDETATDTASSWDVVKEALLRYEEIGKEYEVVTLLQPTAPFRGVDDILKAHVLFNVKKANTVVSVCEVDHSPLWSNTLPEDYSMDNFIRPDLVNSPRQKLKQYYRINGAIYMVRTDYLDKCNTIYDNSSYAYIMDKKHSIDIDDEFDFIMAEALITQNLL